MSKRFGWLLGLVVVVTIAALVACGSNYDPASDGLVIVGSQGSALVETFSFNPFNGHQTPIFNTPIDTANQLCVLPGIPSAIVVDPKGTYAYVILNSNSSCSGSKTGIMAFKVNSDGTMTTAGNLVSFNQETVTVQGTANTVSVNIVPGPMVIDSAGKFIFIADRATTYPQNSATPTYYVPGAISVFAIGSGGSLTEVAGSPFFMTGTTITPTTVPQAALDIVAVAPTPTVVPAIGLNGVQNAVCSTMNPPTIEYLYAVDGLGYQVFQFSVNTSTGVLGNPNSSLAQPPSFATDQIPMGIAVDPCNRFVYVSDSLTNKVSAYTMCNGLQTQSPTCPQPYDGRLVPVAGSPFLLTGSANSPGPIMVDPFGNNVYVVGTLSNTVSALKISPVSGALSALTPPSVATGLQPSSMAIRADGNWLFVTNFNAASVSQYSITPSTGGLSVLPTIQTDNYPFGVAVK